MRFLASLPTFGEDRAATLIWARLSQAIGDLDGICYYQHPPIPWAQSAPDLALLARGYEPLAIRCIAARIEEITSVSEKTWTIGGAEINSPLMDLDDFAVGLQQRFDRDRTLRRRFLPRSMAAFP